MSRHDKFCKNGILSPYIGITCICVYSYLKRHISDFKFSLKIVILLWHEHN